MVIDGVEPVNVIVIPDGADGDAMLGPSCVEITAMDPKPAVGNGWLYVDGAFIPPPVPEPTVEMLQAARAAAYRVESDPLFFRWQRGEGTEQEWLDAVATIRSRYPY